MNRNGMRTCGIECQRSNEFSEFHCCLNALGGILDNQSGNQFGNRCGHVWPQCLNGGWGIELMFEELFNRRPRREWWLPTQEEVHGAAEAVKIGSRGHRARVFGFFRSHVVGSAYDCPSASEIAATAAILIETHRTHQTHIEDLDRRPFGSLRQMSLSGNHNVGWFDVP